MANLELWKKIYSLSDEFFSLKPWEYIGEANIFAVESPESGKEYFISIMGKLGEMYALSAYEDAEGFYKFRELEEAQEELPPETILFIPHIMISLDDREDVPEEQREVIKQLGLKYRGKQSWVNIRQVIPGYFPDVPDQEHVQDLPHILSQSIDVIKRASQDPSFIYNEEQDENEYLFRMPKPKEGGYEWEDQYRQVPEPAEEKDFNPDQKNMEAFTNLPQGEQVIETDLVMIPAPVHNKNEKPYYPFMFLMVDPDSGMVLDFALLTPHPDLDSMISKFPDTLFEKFIKQGKRPRVIRYKSLFIEQAMDYIEEQTGQQTERHSELHALDQAVDSFLKQL